MFPVRSCSFNYLCKSCAEPLICALGLSTCLWMIGGGLFMDHHEFYQKESNHFIDKMHSLVTHNLYRKTVACKDMFVQELSRGFLNHVL